MIQPGQILIAIGTPPQLRALADVARTAGRREVPVRPRRGDADDTPATGAADEAPEPVIQTAVPERTEP